MTVNSNPCNRVKTEICQNLQISMIKNDDIFLIVTLQTVEMEGYSNNKNSPLKTKSVKLPVLFSLSLEPLSVQGSCRVGWSGGVPPLSYS